MKQFVLTLLSAAFVAGSAVAQVATTPKALSGLKSTLPATRMSQRAGMATPLAKIGMANATGRMHVMADDETVTRNPKELSYQVTGNEINSYMGIGSTGLSLSDLKNVANITGIGYAAAFPAIVTDRFAGNKVGLINFVAWMGKYTDAKVFVGTMANDLGDINVLWSAPVTVKTPNPVKQNGKTVYQPQVTSVVCDYVIPDTLKSELFIGWVAGGTAYDSNDPYAKQDGKPLAMIYYPDFTNTGYGAFMMGSKGNDDVFAVTMTNGGNYYYNAPIWVQTTGKGGLKTNDAAILAIDDARNFAGKNGEATVQLMSLGTDSISSIEYTVENGGATKTYTKNFAGEYGLQYMTATQLALPMDMPATAGRSEAKFTITKVNGVADDYTAKTENEGPLPVIALPAETYKRIPVVEELTSTACGWCPYGIAEFNRLADSIDAKKIVKVAIHGPYNGDADPLTCSDYSAFFSNFSTSLPTVLLNRQIRLHPAEGLLQACRYMNSLPCEASLSVKGNNGLAGPNISTTVKFNIDVPANQYALAYVLTEDGVSGVNQVNNFAAVKYMYTYQGQTGYKSYIEAWKKDPYLWALASATFNPKTATSKFDMNHVARAFTEAGENEAGILPALKAGEEWTNSYNLKWPKNLTPAVNKGNCSVAVYLVDASTGKIVTGCQTKLGETNTVDETMTGINDVTVANTAADAQISTVDGAFVVKAHNATARVFDAQGRLVSSATVDGEVSLPTFGTGLFIIRVDQAGRSTTQKALF